MGVEKMTEKMRKGPGTLLQGVAQTPHYPSPKALFHKAGPRPQACMFPSLAHCPPAPQSPPCLHLSIQNDSKNTGYGKKQQGQINTLPVPPLIGVCVEEIKGVSLLTSPHPHHRPCWKNHSLGFRLC